MVELTTAGDGDRERGSVLRSRRGAASVAVERRAGERRDGERAGVRAVTSAAGCSPADDVVLAGLDSGGVGGRMTRAGRGGVLKPAADAGSRSS